MNHSFNPQDLFPSKNDPWLIAAHLPVIPVIHPATPTTCHGTPRTIQRATAKGMTTQRTITTTTSQAHLWFIQSRGDSCFFLLFSFEKLLAPVNFWLSILKPTLETSWFCGKVSSLYLSKKPFFGVIQLGLLTWNNSTENPPPNSHILPWKWRAGTWKSPLWKWNSSKPNLYSCGFKMLVFKGVCIGCRGHLTVHGPIQGFQRHHGSIAEGRQRRTPGTVPEGNEGHHSAGFHAGKKHRFFVGPPFWIHWFHMKNGKILYQQSQIKKRSENGDVLWRYSLHGRIRIKHRQQKPHPRNFSNIIYSLLTVGWGNGNLNQRVNVIFPAILCDIVWMIEWPLPQRLLVTNPTVWGYERVTYTSSQFSNSAWRSFWFFDVLWFWNTNQ